MYELVISALIAVSALSSPSGLAGSLKGSALVGQSFAAAESADLGDAALNSVVAADQRDRIAPGKFRLIDPAEHLQRASVYLANRRFENAREHYRNIVDQLPGSPLAAQALYGMGRSYFLAADYSDSAPIFQRVNKEFPNTKEGRDGLSMYAASLLRSGSAADAAHAYETYTIQYPTGERIESSYLNVIDAYREAGTLPQALQWVLNTRTRFKGSVTESNAVFAKLRLQVGEGDWANAIATADEVQSLGYRSGVQTTRDEITYLKAYSLEKLGRKKEASTLYLSIPDSSRSFYGSLATRHLAEMGLNEVLPMVRSRQSNARSQILAERASYPAPYRDSLLAASARGIDPRFILSIMKQESTFRPWIKSPAAARGLMQLTIDTALKYSPAVGIPHLTEADLYRPATSIAVGGEALGKLTKEFNGSLEAAAAAYNGGEDNVARWLKRVKNTDPGLFAADVGFSESKDYVFKVMANYRAYSELYTIRLVPVS